MHTIQPLDESTWDAFAALVEANDGVFGGCWCPGFHTEGLDRADPAAKRERKLARVRAGTTHAALVFDGRDCLGWCRFGAPADLPRIENRSAYERTRTSTPARWIACTFAGRGHRRQAVATAALAGFLFHAALSTYEQLGFVRDRLIGKHRWVVRRHVEPAR